VNTYSRTYAKKCGILRVEWWARQGSNL